MKARALLPCPVGASLEALAVLPEDTEPTIPSPAAAVSSLRGQTLSTAFWASPGAPSFDELDETSTVKMPSECFEEPLLLADLESVTSLCYSSSGMVSPSSCWEDFQSNSDMESCTPLCFSVSEVASVSPAVCSFSEALLDKLQSIAPLEDDALIAKTQHFDIAGDSDEDDADEQYFPTGANAMCGSEGLDVFVDDKQMSAAIASASTKVESEEDPGQQEDEDEDDRASNPEESAKREVQTMPSRHLPALPSLVSFQVSPTLSVAAQAQARPQEAPTMPARPLAPLPSPAPMQFLPAPRREVFVVTQPQPPSAPHKGMPVQVEYKAEELCGSSSLPLPLARPLLGQSGVCTSDLLFAEQGTIGPEVC